MFQMQMFNQDTLHIWLPSVEKLWFENCENLFTWFSI